MHATFLALDTETTGLTDTDQIINIALVLLTRDLEEISRKEIWAFPEVDVHEKARECNGYTLDAWTAHGAVTQEVMFRQIHEHLANHTRLIMLGHNPYFDRGFLERLYIRFGAKDSFDKCFTYGMLDTLGISLFFDMVTFGEHTGKRNLEKLCSRFGIRIRDAHNAMSDIEATVELLRKMYQKLQACPGVEVQSPKLFSSLLKKANDGTYYISGGKQYVGKSIADVALMDRGYLTWILNKVKPLHPDQRDALVGALTAVNS